MLGVFSLKLLFLTDTHIRGTTPKNRKDEFVDTLERKLLEVVGIIKDYNIDYVLHGGDLFDRPDVSISIVSRFARILKQINLPIYLISGNHDIYGHNPLTLNRTIMGLLNELEILRVIDQDDTIILTKNGIKVQLTGQPYVYDIDDPNNKKYYILEKVENDVDFSIHMVHGMLFDRPFIKGIPYTLIEDIKETKADITLSGHYHSGFKLTKIDDKYFVNPGSMVRITNSLREIERIPQVVVIDLKKDINISFVPLKTAQKGEDVLDRKEIELHAFKRERIYEFKQTIDAAIDFEKMDINDVLVEVSLAEGLSDEVKLEALRRIALIQMKGSYGD